MSTQKALFLTAQHGDWVIRPTAIPTPGPKDVLVKVIATALNPVDWKIQQYGHPLVTEFPFISGTDAAGTVEAVGAEVTNFAKGDRIVFQGYLQNELATFQQYTLVPADLAAKIPENLSFDQAASVPLALASVVTVFWSHDEAAAGHTLDFPAPWEEGGLTEFVGKPIFITGGATSVGQYVIQLAKLVGFSPIITTASLHNVEYLKSLSATHVLDRSLSHDIILAELKKITNGKPLELAYEAVWTKELQEFVYDVVAPGGSVVLVGMDEISDEKKRAEDGKKIATAWGNVHVPFHRKVGVELYSRLTEWLRTGVIVPNRVEVLPNGLAGIPEGLERLKNNKVSGRKLIAHPQETPQ
ncbi:GroES-like protein [Fomes fomentarius]|nr:GroES-like protein [Fomes fomentarius]